MRTNTDGDTIAKAFMQRKPRKTQLASIGFSMYDNEKGRRLVTDGNEILSYEWWLVAYWRDVDEIAITTDRYSPSGHRFKNGNMKYSPTTDAHIGSVVVAAQRAGYVETEQIVHRPGGREFAVYRREE